MRLTKKNEAFLGGYEPLAPYCDVTAKLGKLEDAEEELEKSIQKLIAHCEDEAKKCGDDDFSCLFWDGKVAGLKEALTEIIKLERKKDQK